MESILKEQMDSEYFPVSMSAFPAEIKIREISEEIIRLGPLTVEWQEQVHHPGGSVRYKVNFNGKKVVYATDVELNNIFNKEENSEENRRLGREYIGFISDAELLIADGQYTEDEYPDKVGWGHSSIPVLLDTAFRSNVRQVAIFHHDPQHSDKFLDELWIKNRAIYRSKSRKMDLFWAREGMTLAI